METVQLISMLLDSMDSQYIQENIDKIIDLLGCAAKTIEKLNDENRQFTEKFSALSKDFYEIIIKSEDVCKYCKHHQPCEGKNCKDYIEGKGAWDDKHCYYDWVWSCQDFNYGECPKLENTPCNGCNFENNFEWKGV